jgi:putative ABC transport system permease protein
VAAGIRTVDFSANSPIVTRAIIEREQTRPERQGLLGILSIGFGAALLLTVLGFGLYAVFSLRRRFINLGVLRALGLSQRQMIGYLGCELGLLLGMGLAGGTAIGLTASQVYIPFMQVTATDQMRTLPFTVVINWPPVYGAYVLFAVLFALAVLTLLAFMRRLNVYQAVKLGETI